MAFARNNNNNGRRHNNYNNNRHRHNNQGNAGQNGQRRHVNRINQVFESNGPDGRVRGTAQQIVEKYTGLARDAQMSGDKVLSLNYFQHAEHYQRLLTEITEENAAFERERDAQRQAQQAQPEISGEAAAEGVAASEQPVIEARGDRQERPERQELQPRGDRPERTERAERPQRIQRERRPADDIDDNELPGFLQVPIKSGKPATGDAAGPEVVTTPRRVARPRRVATEAGADAAAEPTGSAE